MLRALTRRVGDLSRCELTHLEPRPIDVGRARQQHAAYEDLLRELCVDVISLPPEPDLPDSVFVEDTAIVLDECAVITRMGVASRRPETRSVAEALCRYRPLHRLDPPGTLEGGDVVRVGRALYVGRSTRTNSAGIEQLRELITPFGYEVREVRVRGCLHLKSACTYLGSGMLAANPDRVDPSAFAGLLVLEVPPHEPRAANSLSIGSSVVLPSGCPQTASLLRERSFDVRCLDISELMKAEAGLTCMSLLFEGKPLSRSASTPAPRP